MSSVDADTSKLLEVYGNPGDPIGNSRLRPRLEAAITLARKFESGDYDSLHAAKLLLAYPDITSLAIEGVKPRDPDVYLPLTDPASCSAPARDYQDPVRFLVPATLSHLRPLVRLIAEKLEIDPHQLWPQGFPKPGQQQVMAPTTSSADAALARLKDYLSDLEPYAGLKDLVIMNQSAAGWLVWPQYDNDLMVFGGAQYFMGTDGGMLCVPSVHSFETVEAAYLNGERCSLTAPADPEDSPEVWARNCGATARAVIHALEGSPEASAFGVLGHWENGQFADGETLAPMLSSLDIKAVPPLMELATIPDMFKSMSTGAHVVVGIQWKGWARGHWFNVRHNGAGPEWVDGQTGSSGTWPPPFLERAEPLGLVLRPVAKKRGWKLI